MHCSTCFGHEDFFYIKTLKFSLFPSPCVRGCRPGKVLLWKLLLLGCWHGDKCEFQCDISPWESKRRCTSPDGKICSNRGLSLYKHLAFSDVTNISYHPLTLTNNIFPYVILNATAGASKLEFYLRGFPQRICTEISLIVPYQLYTA